MFITFVVLDGELYSWASLGAQTVKNLPAVQGNWVHSPGWEDSLQEGMATHSRILAWRIPMDRGAQQAPLLPIKCAIALCLKNNIHN